MRNFSLGVVLLLATTAAGIATYETSHTFSGRGYWILTVTLGPDDDFAGRFSTRTAGVHHDGNTMSEFVATLGPNELRSIKATRVSVPGGVLASASAADVTVRGPSVDRFSDYETIWNPIFGANIAERFQIVYVAEAREASISVALTWTKGVLDISEASGDDILALDAHDFRGVAAASAGGLVASAVVAKHASVASNGGAVGWFYPAPRAWTEASCASPTDAQSCFTGPGARSPYFFGRENGTWDFHVERSADVFASDGPIVFGVALPPLQG